jgi:hypothetical protein
VLGLHPRFDIGSDVFELKIHPGDLNFASGCLPLHASDDRVEITWKRPGDETIYYTLRSPRPVRLLLPCGQQIETDGEWTAELATSGGGPAIPVTGAAGSPVRA